MVSLRDVRLRVILHLMDAFFEILRWVKAFFVPLVALSSFIGMLKSAQWMARRTRWVKEGASEDAVTIIFGHIGMGLWFLILYLIPESFWDLINNWVNP